jgi:hypothetical protein
MTSLPNINNEDSSSTTTHLENLLLETLMKRIQLHDPDNVNDDSSPSQKSFEDFLFGSDDDDEDDAPRTYQEVGQKAIQREESRVEGEIIKLIVSGEGDTLKPNSGEAVTIRESSICVGCHDDEEGEYVVWEWHGHIMGYNDDHGFSPEYIYGNYFQRTVPSERPYSQPVGVGDEDEVDDEADVVSKGLKDLIDDVDTDAAPARILHRSLNAGSAPPRSTIWFFF